MRKIRLGVIGCGGMASNSHTSGLLALSEWMTVTATCDIVLEQAQKMAEMLNVQVAVTDFHDLLDQVDAVLIAIPHDLHFEVGMACLEAGKHVLMEKPMCNTEEECMELISMADRMGKVLMTAYPVRFWPVIIKLKELIDNKTHGDIFQLSIWTEQYTRPPEGSWGLSARQLGGGQFFSHGCHYVDLMLWMLGNPVKGIHLGTNFGTPWMEREGTSNVVLEFENGVMGYHFGTWGARGTRLGYSIHAHCTKGLIEIHLGEGKMYLHSDIKEEHGDLENRSTTEILMDIEPGKLTLYETKHFLDCIIHGTRPDTDGPRSLQGLRVIWKLYEAEQNNTFADLRGLGLELA
ncbi:Gfo/Idh/MocA family protein [Paenibacillus eucommiae]|uniref:Dehydrogenase n=1 Tax=Paenibacillus eucommiae TaxID=1355755 RepID=A0ABS4IR73_9BACL|nr:Gfo/Idh/MocA family oxidoreductase [Paenibacillus eucommiae]MBP1989506.1 putative dehydrogenase [Paenibacillus eucommiae]